MSSPSAARPDDTGAIDRAGQHALPAWQWLALLVGIGLFMAVLFWPDWYLVPESGLDNSWILGLSWAASMGLDWGSAVVYMFGPLGFAFDPMALSLSIAAIGTALFVVAAVGILLAAYLLARSGARLQPVPAIAAAVIVSALAITELNNWLVLVTMAALAAVASRSWVALATTAVGLALIGHMKLSEAVLVLVFALACAFAARGLRGLFGLVAMTGLGWLAVWLVTGQQLADVATWLQGAIEVTLGYSAAMAREIPGQEWQLLVALPMAILVLVLAWQGGAGLTRPQRVVLVVGTAVATWLGWKAAFTRHDPVHAVHFFGWLMLLGMGYAMLTPVRRVQGLGLATALIAYVMIVTVASGQAFLEPIDRSASLGAFGRTMSALASREARTNMIEAARGPLRDSYAITPALEEVLREEPTAVDPFDVSALWASGAAWAPVPMFQPFTAYSPYLDEINTRNLLETPRQLMRNQPYPTVDGRNAVWDSPLYQLVTYCDYDVHYEDPKWQVLRPRGATRCGEVEGAVKVSAAAGEEVAVPARAGALTLATIEPDVSTVEKLLAFLYKPAPTHIRYGDAEWRYAHGSRAVRLMLNEPVWHPAFRSQPLMPFETISVDRDAAITFEFMDVERGPTLSSDGGSEAIRNLQVYAAKDLASTRMAPTITEEAGVDVELPADGCVMARYRDGANAVALTLPDGYALYADPEVGGEARVFLFADGEFTPAQSRGLVLSDAPIEIAVPLDGADSLIRFHMPKVAGSRLCLVPRDK